MPVRVSYKKQFFLLIMLSAIVLVGLEGFVKIYTYVNPNCSFMGADPYQDLGFELQRQLCYDIRDLAWARTPNIHMLPNQHFETVNINNDGFRGPDITRTKIEDTYRIFVIGGSTVFLGTSDETTISGYLQEMFDKKNPELKIQVINAGMWTGFSYTETLYIKNKIIEYEPDLLIIYDGWNDLSKPYELYEKVFSKDDFKDYIKDIFSKDLVFWKTPFFIEWVWEHEFRKLDYEGMNRKILDDKNVPDKVNLWKTRWIEVCEMGNENGFDTIVTLQPILMTSNKVLSETEKKTLTNWDSVSYSNSYQSYVNALVDLKGHCTKTADLRGIFDNTTKPIFLDEVHVGDYGNLIVAERLYQLSNSIIIK